MPSSIPRYEYGCAALVLEEIIAAICMKDFIHVRFDPSTDLDLDLRTMIPIQCDVSQGTEQRRSGGALIRSVGERLSRDALRFFLLRSSTT